MREIAIDIETYATRDLGKCGVYRYAEDPAFEILLFGYSVDGGEIRVVDLARGEKLPAEISEGLVDPTVTKWAFNAQFERVCLSKYLERIGMTEGLLAPESWRCCMIWSAYLGLPLSLEGVGKVLGLEKQKLTEGKELIRYFCVPCAGTKANGGRTRNRPMDDPEKWERFKRYNQRDVETEMGIRARLGQHLVPEQVWAEYHLDQRINDRGIRVDREFVRQAIRTDASITEGLLEKARTLTGLENPNSITQMKEWLAGEGIEAETLGKKTVQSMIRETDGVVEEVLKLRLQTAKSSVKKYNAMENAMCEDDRCRGMFQFYGANRTGRFAGRMVQLQNLPQNHMEDLDEARRLVRAGDTEGLEMLYEDIPDVLSQLIRTAFIPADGMKYIVADYSAIEARVLAWLAGEEWRMRVFGENKDIYCASASAMFGVPVEKHGVNGHLRQKGKIAELALGYGGSCGALISMGALDMGIGEEELKPLVDAWRGSNQRITEMWWGIDRAVRKCLRDRKTTEVQGVRFNCGSGMLRIGLPSGRELNYVKPQIVRDENGKENITYEGIGATKKWERLNSYGPKFVENIVQAISRDLLVGAMGRMRELRIVGHVHDEVIVEVPEEMSVDEICGIMSETPEWAGGLKLRADGYECRYYRKD